MLASAFSIVEENGTAPGRDRYREVIDLAGAADRVGLEAFWVAEHHFQPGGLCPSPAVMLAALATKTRRLRLGSLVSVLPFHDPVETAEAYALVDRLSGGRLNFGVGSGYVPAELAGFGVDLTTKRERFDRSLETILKAWRGEEVTTERAPHQPIRLNVLPVSRPSPPVWVAVQRRESIVHVARKGLALALIPYATVTRLEELGEQIREFRGASPFGARARVSAAFHVYAAEDPALGLRALQRYLDDRRSTGSVHFQAKVERDPHQADARTIVAERLAFVGAPADLPEWVHGVAAQGVDELLGIFDFGGIPLADSVASMESLGRAVAALDR